MIHELQVRKEINDLLEQQHEQKKHLGYINHLLSISKWLTFGLYLAFTLSLYLGDILHIQTLVTSFFGSMPGFIFYLLICLALAYVLAGIKHAAYSHFAMFGVAAGIVVVVIAMGLMAEVFQSSGNQDTKARAIAESNPEYQNIVNTKPSDNIRIDAGLSAMIAAAEQKLARCEDRMIRGKEKHCKGDLAKLNSYKASQDSFMAEQTAVAQSVAQSQFDRIDKILNESYNPVIRSISTMANTDIASAIALIMFFIAINFEVLHYFLSNMKAKTLNAIRRLNDGIRALEIQYYNVAGVEFDGTAHTTPPEIADKEPTGWTPFDKPIPATASANIPAPTAPSVTRFKYQHQPTTAQAQKFVGFVNPNTPVKAPQAKLTPVKAPENTVLGTHEEQLNIPELSTYNVELAEHNIDSPADKAMEQSADKASIERIIANGKTAGTPRSEPLAQNLQNPSSNAGSNALAGRSEHPEKQEETAKEQLASADFQLLESYVKNPKFDPAFTAIATGSINCSQKQAMKHHNIGAEMSKWLMVILDAGEIVSPRNSTTQQRTLIKKLSAQQAARALEQVKAGIIGTTGEANHA